MRFSDVMKELRRMADPAVVEGMKRFGLPVNNALGITAPKLRSLAKKIGKNQAMSLELWKTGFQEARVLAALIGESDDVTKRQMNSWARDFDSWGVCDACCYVLFVRSKHAMEMSFKWSKNEREFVKRAGFVLMAAMAVHQKALDDVAFVPMLREIEKGCRDERGFVKKAVNWALRQIGKRNNRLNKLAVEAAIRMRRIDSRAAKWIAVDALRELQSEAVQRRLRAKSKRRKPS